MGECKDAKRKEAEIPKQNFRTLPTTEHFSATTEDGCKAVLLEFHDRVF